MEKIVRTKYGKVKGLVTDKCVSFVSIPYATTKRFSDPAPYFFDDVFDATKKQVNCPQRCQYTKENPGYHKFFAKEFEQNPDSNFIEDYMTLSITTPIDKKNCPVIAYIHGGSFENGCVEDVPFGQNNTYTDKGIIFVSIGYRLNVFGLYGNNSYGLKDQAYALKWINENISSFGGSAEDVVLMGQSAGAMSINSLLLDNDLKGLFKAAIMLSGYGTIPKIVGPRRATDGKTMAFWQRVMKSAGCDNDQQLLKVDSETLWRSWYKERNTKIPMPAKAPGLDGVIIKDEPQKILKKKLDIDVPILFGIVGQDMFPYMIVDLGFRAALRKEKIGHKPVYGYFFDHIMPGNSYKCYHGCDLWYVFKNMDKSWRKFDANDCKLSDTMVQYITNFIYNCDPNGQELELWQPISKKHQKLRYFSDCKQTEISRFKARNIIWKYFLTDKGPI